MYPSGPIILIVDNFSSHWRQLKGQVAANRLYGAIQVLLDTVAAFFKAMTPEQALLWAAV